MPDLFENAIHDGAVWSAPRFLRYSHELRESDQVVATIKLSSWWHWGRRAEGLLLGQPWSLDARVGWRAAAFTVRFGPGRPTPEVAVYTVVDRVTLRDHAGATYRMPDGVFRWGTVLDESGLVILEHHENPMTGELTESFGPGADESHPTTGLVLLCQCGRMFENHVHY